MIKKLIRQRYTETVCVCKMYAYEGSKYLE